MNYKTLLKASLVSAVIMWMVAGVAHEILFEQFFADASHEGHKGPAVIFIAYCILALIMSYLFSICPRGQRWVVDGMKFGALMGVLWVFPHGLAMAAAHSQSISHELINGVWHIFEQCLGGLVIAYYFKDQIQKKLAH